MKNDFLLELVHSLSFSEKRYFRLYAKDNATKRDTVYLELFKLIEKHGTAEKSLLEKYSMSSELANNFSFHKNYLYNQLLQSITAYQAKNDNYIKTQQLLVEVHVLIERKLIKQAEKRLRTAKKNAARYHYDLIMVQLLFLERSIIRGFSEKKSFSLLEGVHLETNVCLEQLASRIKVTDLYDKLYLVARNKSLRKQHQKEVLQQLDSEKDILAKLDYPYEGKMVYHLLFVLYYQLFTKESKRSLEHLKILIEFYESDSALLQNYMPRYINLLNNYLNFFYLQNDFTPFKVVIDKLSKLKSTSKSIQLKLTQTIYHLRMVQAVRTHQYESAVELVPEIEQWLVKEGIKIPKQNRLLLHQNIALAFFHVGEHAPALHWVGLVVNESKQDIRQDVNLLCRLLELLIQFELQEYELVQHIARSIIRLTTFSESSEPMVLFANELSKTLRKAANSPPHKIGKIFFSLKTNLLKNTTYINGKEDVLHWVERQLSKASY